MKFWIWSFEHRAWWRQGGNGYTPNIKEAGTFSFEKAVEICRDSHPDNPEEAMVPIVGKGGAK